MGVQMRLAKLDGREYTGRASRHRAPTSDTQMKSCPIAVTPRLPSHPFAMPSIPSPPNSFEMSEKSTAYVSSSDASARDESARSGRAMSVTSVLLPVVTLPNMCVSAPRIGLVASA